MDQNAVLKELSLMAAVSGYEENMSSHIRKLFKDSFDDIYVDKFYNVIGTKKGLKGNKRVMVTAHYDEIGFLVSGIEENGFLRLTNVGGIDAKILLAQEVIIHGKTDLFGIIGAKPPHLLKPDEAKKAVRLQDLRIDTGMSETEVRKMVSIGDTITLKAVPLELQNGKISSKTMDNRCGLTAHLRLLQELDSLKHDCDVLLVATSQEEFDLAGVEAAAYNLQPDMAIVIDTCHGDMPDAPKDETYPLGKGPAIGIGPNLHPGLSQRIIEIAKSENIPYQIDVENGNTGTEAWATQVSRKGIPTVLLSIPLRYMHTAVETVKMKDISNTARLAARFIAKAGNEMEDLLCF